MDVRHGDCFACRAHAERVLECCALVAREFLAQSFGFKAPELNLNTSNQQAKISRKQYQDAREALKTELETSTKRHPFFNTLVISYFQRYVCSKTYPTTEGATILLPSSPRTGGISTTTSTWLATPAGSRAPLSCPLRRTSASCSAPPRAVRFSKTYLTTEGNNPCPSI